MDEAILSVCQALKEEAESVISYTEKIAALGSDEATKDTAQALDAIRLDEVEHIQNLTLELTKLITSGTAEPPDTEEAV